MRMVSSKHVGFVKHRTNDKAVEEVEEMRVSTSNELRLAMETNS